MKTLIVMTTVLLMSSTVYGEDSPTPNGVIPTAGKYVVYTNGKRDHRAELRLLQMEKQYKQNRYVDYTIDQVKRRGDYEIKRKIDAEINRVMKKVF